jgi:TM2 domain-containing membrane protein YozV
MTDPLQPPPAAPTPPGRYGDPAAPFGRHPVTGEPYSDKSKIVAGLLQLLGLLGLVGIGRMYLGQVGYGIAQLIVGWVTFGVGAWIWGIIDAVLILTDRVRDRQGRPLRD